MFTPHTDLVDFRGKVVTLLPESFTVVVDQFLRPKELDPADLPVKTTDDHYYAVACYWRAIESGTVTTSYGAFTVNTPQVLRTFEEFKAVKVTPSEWVEYELNHKVGKKTPYNNPHYTARWFSKIESFYDAGFHNVIHLNPEVEAPGLDGWYKWKNR